MENIMSREDYIEVSERIQRFYEKYPDGSLQGCWTWMGPGHDVIVFRAEAFRSQEDTRPGIGHASEPYPGLTSFTKNSEMMNAETSAWGRAIASLGIAVHRGIASAQEVRAAQRGTDVTPIKRVATTEDDNGWYGPPVDKTPHVDHGPSAAQMTYAGKEPATDKQLKMIIGKLSNMGIVTPVEILEFVNAVLHENGMEQVAGSSAMTKQAASKVIAVLVAESPAQ
jgi:hypothetical protein